VPAVRGTTFGTAWSGRADGLRRVRLTCATCRTFVRHLGLEGGPEPKCEPTTRTDRAHPALAAPTDGWVWIGLIRQSDQVWRAVALGRAWDALLHYPGEGDLLVIPSLPATQGKCDLAARCRGTVRCGERPADTAEARPPERSAP